MDFQEFEKKLKKEFGSRLSFLGYQILMQSMSGQPCDITFWDRKPAINVIIDNQIALAVMYGAGAKKLGEKLGNISLSNGDEINITEIWTFHPMPKGGFSKEELDKVDMSKAEEEAGPQGETLREMIKNSYHCENKEEEDYYLRRFLAS